jgi:ribose transport system substrate-binding protein
MHSHDSSIRLRADPRRLFGHGPARRRYRYVAILSVVAIAAAACGSTSHGSVSQSVGTSAGAPASGAAGVAAAKAALVGYEQELTNIPETIPLPSKPPTGKKVGYVVCTDPGCVRTAAAMKVAASFLGWTVLTANASATDPGAAFQSLINQRVDYLSVSGMDPDAGYQPQLTEARSMHIPVFVLAGTVVPAGTANGIYSDYNDNTLDAGIAKIMASWLIADSNGAANVLFVNLPLYRTFVVQEGDVKSDLQSGCPSCGFHNLDLTLNEVQSGTVPQTIVNYLKTNTNVDYVDVAYDGIATGLPSALKAAGLSSRVKVAGLRPSQGDIQAIVAGTEAAAVQLGLEAQSWSLVDQMTRYADNVWSLSEERAVAGGGIFLIDTPAQAAVYENNPQVWVGPAGYQAQFEKLWKAS